MIARITRGQHMNYFAKGDPRRPGFRVLMEYGRKGSPMGHVRPRVHVDNGEPVEFGPEFRSDLIVVDRNGNVLSFARKQAGKNSVPSGRKKRRSKKKKGSA